MSSANSSDNKTPALLSVILPVYNEQEVLPQTYARFSAMEQTLAQWGLDYELVFVNDGSRDNSPDLLNGMAGNDRRLQPRFSHPRAIAGDARGQHDRLRVGREVELILRALVDQTADVFTQCIGGFSERALHCRVVGPAIEHAHRLRALAWKNECERSHRENSSVFKDRAEPRPR